MIKERLVRPIPGLLMIGLVLAAGAGAIWLFVAAIQAARPALVAVAAGEPGTRLRVSGLVVGSDGRPLASASIYLYHTDAKGEYVPGQRGGSDRPRLFGYLRSDALGRYEFETIKPGSYPNSANPAHIHFEVVAANHPARFYEIVFEGDQYLTDRIRQVAANPLGAMVLVASRTRIEGGLEVRHEIRLR